MATFNKFKSGWFNDSYRHSLAAKGVKTGRFYNKKNTLNTYFSRRGVKKIQSQIDSLRKDMAATDDFQKRLVLQSQIDRLERDLEAERGVVGPAQPAPGDTFRKPAPQLREQQDPEERLRTLLESRLLKLQGNYDRAVAELDEQLASGEISQEDYDSRKGQLGEAPRKDEFFDIQARVTNLRERNDELKEMLSRQLGAPSQIEGATADVVSFANVQQANAYINQINPRRRTPDGEEVDRVHELRMRGEVEAANELQQEVDDIKDRIRIVRESAERAELFENKKEMARLINEAEDILGLSRHGATEQFFGPAVKDPASGRVEDVKFSVDPSRVRSGDVRRELIKAMEAEQEKRMRALQAKDQERYDQLKQVRDSEFELFRSGETTIDHYQKVLEELDRRLPEGPAPARTREAREKRARDRMLDGQDDDDILPRRG